MKILIDMNLSPEWVEEFKFHDIEAVHWSAVGKFEGRKTKCYTGKNSKCNCITLK